MDRTATRFSGIGTLLLACCLAVPGGAVAGDSEFTLDFASAYVWRGVTLTDGAVFQPSVTASTDGGFSINVWGNLDIDDVNGLDGEFNEVDITLSYAFGGDGLSGEFGLIEYLFPNTAFAGTREAYFTLGFGGPLSPSATIYYDFDEVDGFYATFSIERGGELAGGAEWSLGLLAGYAGEDYAIGYGGLDAGFYNGEVSLSISKGFWSAWVAYTDTLDEDALPEQPVDFYGGIGFSF